MKVTNTILTCKSSLSKPGKSKTWRTRLGLVLACSAACACMPGDPEPLFWLANDAPLAPLCVEFAARKLSDCAVIQAPASGDAAPSLPAAWPAVLRSGGRLQLNSATGFWFENEIGLRLQAHTIDDETAAARFTDSLALIAASAHEREAPSAYPRAVAGAWTLETRRKSELKTELAGATHLIDATPSAPGLFEHAAFAAAQLQLVARAPLNPDTTRRALPARFPRAGVSLAVRAQELVWLYPLPNDPGRLLLLRLQSTEAAQVARAALDQVPGVNTELLAQASRPSNAITVSEAYFDLASGAPALEVASGAQPTLAQLTIETDGRAWRHTEQRYFFAHSAALYDGVGDASFRMKDSVALSGAVDFFLEKRALSVYAPQRALVWPEESLAQFPQDPDPMRLRPAERCVLSHNAWCGSPGIAPGALPRISASRAACTAADFSLSEMNPYGVRLANDALAADGKFVEFEARAACDFGRILFRAGETWLDPGPASVRPQELIVFAGSAAYFEEPIRLAPDLRYLHAQHAIEVIDIATGERRQLRAATADLYPAPGATRGFARLHSLRFTPEERHHASASVSGLRPDLRAANAMSPGRAAPLLHAPLALQLSEILPQGGRTADGGALASEEFLEVAGRSRSSDSDDTLILEIYEEDGALANRYRIPPPALGPGEHAALGRAPSACFAPDERAVLPELSLPNRAASYRLANAAGETLDFVRIDRAAYAAIDRSPTRASYARLDYARGALWRPSDGVGARSPLCQDATRATPGAPESFAPFVLQEERAAFTQNLRLLGEASEALWRLEFASDAFAAQTAPLLRLLHDQSHAVQWNGDADAPRILYRLTDCESGVCELRAGGELFAAQVPLIIAAVAPTPMQGEHEWLRVCSPDGYDLAAETRGLFLEDRRERDAVVPMAVRAPGLPAPPGLDPARTRLLPGECALIVDPDFRSGAPPLTSEDRALWTAASGASLGDGLASSEALRLVRLRETGQVQPLASYGRPEFEGAGLPTRSGEYVRRRAGTLADEIENWELVP